MINKILGFFSWLLSFWKGLSDEDKEKIVDIVVHSMTQIFKTYYRSSKKSEG
ncbi:hypothetical protein P0F40_003381 [Vibrio metschnikovii]|uniref:Uncharacterized protein n=3 Tax=Unclassified Bacteria TaxID=49928 RepID=A0AAU6UXC1_UNCXX|nr:MULTISPECIES: hypothetical protein [Vibrio]EKO3590963.1 hypothetical protein [Vibrio metschnikovii]EKO3594212.1 hypothetical protein [Vibrio metschnikovii]EKO3643161.1 hypothetical protein [Vibrio metschnikovii]EKO3667543.1 hypothetical protein [Vibrio metschnikovii]EKO3695081.1 hypothetical protein [Vibrio metschnikovii]